MKKTEYSTRKIWRILPNLRACPLSVDLPLYRQKPPFQRMEPAATNRPRELQPSNEYDKYLKIKEAKTGFNLQVTAPSTLETDQALKNVTRCRHTTNTVSPRSQGCGVGVVGSRRFLDGVGVGVGILRVLGAGVGIFDLTPTPKVQLN